MLNPIEQSPALAFEPARQQYVHHPQAEGAAAVTAAQAATLSTTGQVQQAATGTATGDSTGNGASGNSSDGAGAQSNASQQLGAAWSTLTQLKHQAAAALSSGNLSAARVLASEAAGIAGSIRDIVAMAGGSGTAGAQLDIQEANLVAASTPVGEATTATTPHSQTVSPLDLARSGLASAKELIDSVLSQPAQTQTEQSALISQQQSVISAMSAVENVAAQISASNVLVSSYASHSLVDIKA